MHHKRLPYVLEDVAFDAPGTGDVRRTYELIVRCDVDDYGEPDSDLADLQSDWSRIDLQRDAWLAQSPTGELIGYAAVVPWGPSLRYDLYLDPRWEGQDLGNALLARCEGRGIAMVQATGKALAARCYVAPANERLQEIVTRAGFALLTHHYQMEIRLDKPVPAPRWPEGISLRIAVSGQDEQAIHQLIETAFAHPGRTPTTLDQWQGLMQRADLYDPGLWFLAVSPDDLVGGEIVGVCLSFAYPATGWVRQLAVAETWRRKGIGTALLRHAFALFQERGYDRAGLTVDAENENALRFYQRTGLCPVRQHDEYSKSVGKEPQ